MRIYLFLLFTHLSSAAKHSLKYFLTTSNGVPNFPEFMGAALVDDLPVLYCDNITKSVEPKQECMKQYLDDNPDNRMWYAVQCFKVLPYTLKDRMDNVMQRLNQTGDVHTLQWMVGCEWDEESEKITGFNQYGYDGEDFISLDHETRTWVAPRPEAVNTKQKWDVDERRIKQSENFCTYTCPDLLKEYVKCGNSTLLRRVPPSVSLLQTTPSSPVSCLATGFIPPKAEMLWTKDGEELHEDVTRGEILPNHDGTFQLSVDLNISSIEPEDWKRYDCVFQLSGTEINITTKLDKAVIRTNWENPSQENSNTKNTVIIIIITSILVVVILFLRHLFAKKRSRRFSPQGRNYAMQTMHMQVI